MEYDEKSDKYYLKGYDGVRYLSDGQIKNNNEERFKTQRQPKYLKIVNCC